MRFSRAAGWALIVVMAGLLAGDALSADVLPKKKPVLLPKAKPAPAKVIALAPAKPVAKYGFHASRPRLPPVVAKPAKLAPAPAPTRSDLEKPVLVAVTGDWSAFRATKADASTCFAATMPKDTSPSAQRRAASYLYLTNESAGSVKHELTLRLGFTVAATAATANVDGREFPLATADGLAYPPDRKAQNELILAMRRGHTLLLRTTLSGSGTQSVTDVYSMLGVDDVLKTADAACTSVADRR